MVGATYLEKQGEKNNRKQIITGSKWKLVKLWADSKRKWKCWRKNWLKL